jgi:hypothetical protein
VKVAQDTSVTIRLESSDYGHVVYGRIGGCGASGTQQFCFNASSADDTATVALTSGQTLYLYVDGMSGAEGSYRLSLEPLRSRLPASPSNFSPGCLRTQTNEEPCSLQP